ncbi:MAG: YqeG family HAD IIIA-type phosphatase [Angelakisella sp.]|nr:YqeG family HAD IIIA-type phosphatase [Angelakisella sp.]
MSVFYPHYDFKRVYMIPSEFWQHKGITALLLDVDNTLTTHDNPIPHDEVLNWLEQQRNAGLRLMILSNNHEERVRSFAQKLGLEYIADAAKPLPWHLKHALKKLGVSPSQTALIGDQIFTDILCGRLTGCTTVLVEPMESETSRFFRFKRKLEIGILKQYRRSKEKL